MASPGSLVKTIYTQTIAEALNASAFFMLISIFKYIHQVLLSKTTNWYELPMEIPFRQAPQSFKLSSPASKASLPRTPLVSQSIRFKGTPHPQTQSTLTTLILRIKTKLQEIWGKIRAFFGRTQAKEKTPPQAKPGVTPEKKTKQKDYDDDDSPFPMSPLPALALPAFLHGKPKDDTESAVKAHSKSHHDHDDSDTSSHDVDDDDDDH